MLERLRRMLEQTQYLLALANEEAWDDFDLEFTKYDALSNQLPNIVWSDYDDSTQIEIRSVLLQLQDLHQKIIPLALNWQLELKGMLHSEVHSRKLDEKYR